MTTAELNAQLEAELTELQITRAIREDRLRLAHQIAQLREKQVMECGLGLIGGEPVTLKAGQHDRYPEGRARALQPT